MIAVIIALTLAGCGSAVGDGRSTAPSYEGPLTAEAATDALECHGRRPSRRSEVDYGLGLETVQSSAEDAFDNYTDRSGIRYWVPVEGYRVERRQEGRALLSYDVSDRTKVAVVVADGIRDWKGDVGWGVVAWAHCDAAEFPAEVTEDLNIGVWEDATGRRVPVSQIRSFKGPEHCSWTNITFLLIGPDEERADWYVLDTSGELSPMLRGKFGVVAELPRGAVDTGWRRSGRQLWLGPDKEAAYLVSLDDRHNIQRWPAATEPIMCA